MTDQTGTTTETTEGAQEAPEGTDAQETTTEGQETAPEGQEEAAEVMPGASADDLRAEVRRLRDENAAARVRGRRVDDLEQRLHAAQVTALGRLADPSDLPFDPVHVDDHDALVAAVDELLARKPHLSARRFAGDVGQGAAGAAPSVSLAGLLRASAG